MTLGPGGTTGRWAAALLGVVACTPVETAPRDQAADASPAASAPSAGRMAGRGRRDSGADSRRGPPRGADGGTDGSGPPSELDALLARCAADEEGSGGDCGERLQQLAKRRALLEVDGRRREAAYVYLCRELGRTGRERDPWRCSSELTHADDTLHAIELAADQVLLLGSSSVGRLVDTAGETPPGLIKVGAGPALEMHADGYVAARRIPVQDDGAVPLAAVPTGRDTLLFALYRHDAHWVRKHVWLVRRSGSSPASPARPAPAPAAPR